jgi:hypothetical protein
VQDYVTGRGVSNAALTGIIGCRNHIHFSVIHSESNKRVPIFSFVTQGGKEVSSYL